MQITYGNNLNQQNYTDTEQLHCLVSKDIEYVQIAFNIHT